MEIKEIFGNFGLGMGIIISLVVILIVISLIAGILPVLLGLVGNAIYLMICLAAICLVIYFIGKFAKGFIK